MHLGVLQPSLATTFGTVDGRILFFYNILEQYRCNRGDKAVSRNDK